MSDSYIALVEKSIDERTQQYQELLRLRADLAAVTVERDALAARLAPVEPIESDKDDPTREYIPLPGGWEIQTKGKGSSYRLLDKKTGERHIILASDVPFIHAFVTRMAKEINASAQVQPVAPVEDDSRHLTTEEQKVFNSALRRSAKSVTSAQVCEVHAPSAMWADGTHQPKDDEALVEIGIGEIERGNEKQWHFAPIEAKNDLYNRMRAAIAAIRPHIEAAERERVLREIRENNQAIRKLANDWGMEIKIEQIRSRK